MKSKEISEFGSYYFI